MLLNSADITPYLGNLIKFRRDIHANPELKYEETRTAEKVCSWLEALGLKAERGLGGTGVVATIVGTGPDASDPKRAIAFRADMDALPMQEANSFEHASKAACKMHACGHDGHTAMLLGGATLLAKDPNFNGRVHLIFQPAEEGGAGAKKMMDEGLFARFPAQAVFALHNWPLFPAGKMGVRGGPIMASANRFEIRITGRGGHAAQPHTTIDPVPIACAIVGELQRLVSRSVDPLDSAVITIGRVDAGTVANIIPDTAVIYGTCRTLRPETQKMLVKGIERIASHVAQAHLATAELTMSQGYPATVNTRTEAGLMAEVMTEVAGSENVNPDIEPSMGAEDFGFMLQELPGAYGFIGNGANGKPGIGLHNPAYDFNDDILGIGAQFWDRLARRYFA